MTYVGLQHRYSAVGHYETLVVALQASPSKAVMQLFGAVAAAQLAFSGTDKLEGVYLHLCLEPKRLSSC